MLRFIVRRFVQLVVTVLVATFGYFIAFHYSPFGYFKPFHPSEDLLPVGAGPKQYAAFDAMSPFGQYWHILRMWLSGDLGYSQGLGEPLSTMVAAAYPYTLVLVASALVFGVLLGVPFGIVRGMRLGTRFDRASGPVATVIASVPAMVGGQILVVLFAIDTHLFPAEGPQANGFGVIFGDYRAMVLPVASLMFVFTGRLSQVTRSAVLDQMVADYPRAAQACGVSPWRLLTRHLARNVAGPIVVFIGTALPLLISGAAVVEALFNMQGLGFKLATASGGFPPPPYNTIYPPIFEVQFTILLVVSIAASALVLLADLAVMVIDPRVPRR